MSRFLVPALLLLSIALGGCASAGIKAASFGLEAVDASKAFVDEQVQRRQELRKRLYEIDDREIQAHMTRYELLWADGKRDEALAELDAAREIVVKVYPSLTGIVTGLNKIHARELGIAPPKEE